MPRAAHNLMGASLVAMVAVASATWAQDTDTGAPADDALVVTGSALAVADGEALQPADVFSTEDLQTKFLGGLGDTLDSAPGVSSTYFGPAASRPIIRGLDGDRVRVLRNGVGLIDVSSVSVDHAVTSEVLEAERIEVLRGPAAIAYGGNAVGGVVNIIDAAIATEPVDGLFDGAARFGYTSVDEGRQAAVRGRTGAGPFVLSLEASTRESENFEIPGLAESARFIAMEEAEEAEGGEGHDEEDEVSGEVLNTDYRFETLGGGVSLVGDWGFAGLSVKVFDAEYGLPGGHEHEHEGEEGEEGEEEGPEFFDGPRLDMSQVRIDSRGELAHSFFIFDTLTYSAGYSNYEHEEIEPNLEVATSFENEGWELRGTAERRNQGPLSGVVGFQTFRTDFSAVGEEAFVPPVVTEDFGVFAAGRYDLGEYGFEAGARFERRDLEAVDGDLSQLPEENLESRALLGDFNPDTDFTADLLDQSFDLFSISAGVFTRPSDNVFLSANLSRTERAPVDYELFAGGPHLATNAFEVGDPRLDKEVATSLDLGARFDGDGISVEAGLFATSFEDFIFLAAIDAEEDGLPVFLFAQDDATFYGGEFVVDAELGETQFGDFTSDLVLDYVVAEADDAGDLPRIPPLSATVGLNWSMDRLGARGEVVYAGEQDNTAAFELPTDSHTLINLSASWQPWAETDTRFLVGVRNLTDEEARVHSSFLKDQVPLAGRSFTISVATTF